MEKFKQCPFCGSIDIENYRISNSNIIGAKTVLKGTCKKCGKIWHSTDIDDGSKRDIYRW